MFTTKGIFMIGITFSWNGVMDFVGAAHTPRRTRTRGAPRVALMNERGRTREQKDHAAFGRRLGGNGRWRGRTVGHVAGYALNAEPHYIHVDGTTAFAQGIVNRLSAAPKNPLTAGLSAFGIWAGAGG